MLTAKEERYCKAVAVEGKTYTDAYKTAYNTQNMADKTVNEKACLMAKKDKIRARIEQLRQEITDKEIMSAKDRAKWLTDAINQLDVSMPDKLKALDILNKMTGEYVQKVQADVSQEIEVNITLED